MNEVNETEHEGLGMSYACPLLRNKSYLVCHAGSTSARLVARRSEYMSRVQQVDIVLLIFITEYKEIFFSRHITNKIVVVESRY